jgi:UDPglucose 6-dehydrogenase
MTAVGWIGLGKLGLPCALACERYGGHTVTGYDPDQRVAGILRGDLEPPREDGIRRLLAMQSIKLVDSPAKVVAASDVVFVAVQTPHEAVYSGEKSAPALRRDFDYRFLVQAVRAVATSAAAMRKVITLVIVSTVLPGTTSRLIVPLLNAYTRLVYGPEFLAMGTAVSDFVHPEFVVCGSHDEVAVASLTSVHRSIHNQPLIVTSIETAEMIKIAYNTFLSTKIVFGNMIMELCHKTGADCDQVVAALAMATKRVISADYLYGGMGDGGACRPRDLVALAWLADRVGLSFDMPGELIRAREAQTRWLADVAIEQAELAELPICLLGKSYKPESDLTNGSPALLLSYQLRELGWEPTQWDPYTDDLRELNPRRPKVFVIATQHERFASFPFPEGSVIIDPFGYIPAQTGVALIRIGRK